MGNHVNVWEWREHTKDEKKIGFVIFNYGCFMCSMCPEMFVGWLLKNMHLSSQAVNNAWLMCVNALVSLHLPFLHRFFGQHKAISLWEHELGTRSGCDLMLTNYLSKSLCELPGDV